MSDLTAPIDMASFGAALDDADMLIDYAASVGLATMASETVSDIEHARQAWRQNQITARVATDFWLAYSNLASVTKPATAASVRASKTASSVRSTMLMLAILLGFTIAFSIFVFVNNTIGAQTTELIEEQNVAALRLWSGLQVLRSPEQLPNPSRRTPGDDNTAAFLNHIFEETVDFSRRSQWLLQSTIKLHFWFNPWLTSIDARPLRFDETNPVGVKHLSIPPDISGLEDIRAEAMNQIMAFQLIRDYSQAVEKSDSIIYGGITTLEGLGNRRGCLSPRSAEPSPRGKGSACPHRAGPVTAGSREESDCIRFA